MDEKDERHDPYQTDEDEPMLPLDERFRLAEQDVLDLFPEEEEERNKKAWRRLLRLIWS